MTQRRRDEPAARDPAAHPAFHSLALRAIEARDSERAALSRFLHDDIAQFLSGIGLQLDILAMDLENRVPEIGARVAEIQQILEQVVTRVRDLSNDLNPKTVEHAGLKVALELLAGRFKKRFPGGVRLLLDCKTAIPPHVASLFCRIAELALDNALQHSGGDQVEVLFRDTRRGVVLEVRDNGRGFDCEAMLPGDTGLGLAAMHYYASRAGIKLRISSRPGKGCSVKTTFAGPANGNPGQSV